MKRLLLLLLGALALPTAISSETIFLTCTFTESKAVHHAEPLKLGWDWIPTINNVYKFTVNTNTNSGTLYEVNFNELHKFNDVYINPKTIVIKNNKINQRISSFDAEYDTFTINRLNGQIERDSERFIEGTLQHIFFTRGKCLNVIDDKK